MRRTTFSARSAVSAPAAAAAALAAILLLAGCTSGASDSSDSGSGSGESGSYDTGVVEPAPAEDSGAKSGFSSDSGSTADLSTGASAAGDAAIPATAGRQVVTTGQAVMTADDPLAAGDDAVRIVETAGGRVDGRNEHAPINGDSGRVSLVLRIPSEKLTATLDELKALGETVSVNLSSQDVTTASQDLDARIGALSASVDRLVGLLSSATDTAVLIQLETAISDRQGQLESMQAERRSLTDQVAMSTLTLELVSETDAPATAPRTFWDALQDGLTGFAAVFTGLFFVIGYLVPWLALVAVGSLAVLWVMRRRRRQRDRERERREHQDGIVTEPEASTPTSASGS